MTPLLFISLTTAVLVLLLYWILSTLDLQERPKRKDPKSYHFETAQELFKYLEPDTDLPFDSIKIAQNRSGYRIVTWNLSQEKWEERISERAIEPDERFIILRLEKKGRMKRIYDIPVGKLNGSYEFKANNNESWTASLGFKDDTYEPILTL
ncbi:MAG: hypothetical protein PHT79_04980 [Syntrophomonadaceae bacterium]|nr:hypothetical protein [Syntrophomonadaceae bacterium]MDD3889557.1 hypothetical protein [Syntrophomonadaceae bacterium]MDD4549096.1 hypothetical protein [Syntrophomonadaceae bacterium]